MQIAISTILDNLSDVVVPDARDATSGDSRWLNAIDSAYDWLLWQDSVTYDAATHALTVQSATHPSVLYVANGKCQCRASANGEACWHRAAARLVRRSLEANAQDARWQAEADLLECFA
jgi:hypothetical protein